MPPSQTDNQKSSLPGRKDGPRGRLRWHFAQAAAHLQSTIEDIPWDQLEACQGAERVKVAENRDVWRIDLADRVIFAKCYRTPSLSKRLTEAVRGLAAKREWKALRQASRLGVQAPDPIGYARSRQTSGHGYHAILVTAAMPADAVSLHDAWLEVTGGPASPQTRQRKGQLIHALAELIARAHAGGLIHRDLHVNNILIFKNGHGPTAAMIDLHNARLCSRICLSGVRNNLVQLNQWFAKHASRNDRLRFLKVYSGYLRRQMSVAGDAREPYSHKALARDVMKRATGYAAHLHRKRDRRIFKRNKYFATLPLADDWCGRVALEIKHGRPYSHPMTDLPTEQEWADILKDPASLLAGGPGQSLKASSGSQVLRCELPYHGSPWTVIVKHEKRTSLLRRIAGQLGWRVVPNEFVTGWKCLHRQIPVAVPLARLQRGGVWQQESALLSEFIPDSRDLDTFVKLHLRELPAAQALAVKHRISLELARTLRRMWSCRMAHRDLKAANIRVQIASDDPREVKIVLVDLDGIRKVCWNQRAALLRSLARLDASFAHCPTVTRTDRLRLLRAVLRSIDCGGGDWKGAWHRITRMSQRDQATIAKTLPWLQPAVGAAGAQ